MSYFPNQINGLQPTHTSPTDGSATYTSNTSITLSGFSFTVDDTSCLVVYILYKPSGGQWQAPLMNGINGVSIVASSNVLTVSGVTTPFASGDTYAVGIFYLKKSYESVTNSDRSGEVSPLNTKFIPTELLNATNVTAGTYYYPSSSGGSMDDYKDQSLTGDLIDADGDITLTLWVYNGSSPGTGTFVQAKMFNDNSGTLVDSVSCSSSTTNFAVSMPNNNFTYFYFQVVFSGSTNTARLNMRQKAL